MTSKNLWPRFPETETQSPKKLMQEQAKFLAKRTADSVIAEINIGSTSQTKISLSFQIIVPNLGNYRYLLFFVVHDISLYPLDFNYQETTVKLETPDELTQKMKEVFNSPETITKIAGLISYGND